MTPSLAQSELRWVPSRVVLEFTDARRNKLLVSWGRLVIAAPLAGSLLAPLRCAGPMKLTPTPRERITTQQISKSIIPCGIAAICELLHTPRPHAPPAESLPTPKFFCKNVFHTKATLFMFFVRGGMTKFS